MTEKSISKTISNISGEKPLAILKPNQAWCTFGVLVIFVLFLYSIFGVILPVLMTGDYATMWISSRKGIEYRITIFYAAWIVIPGALFLLILILRTAGTYNFYHDRVELCTYWMKKEIIIPYNQMYVIRRKMGVNIMRENLPDWTHPLKRFKIRYWNGVGFGTNFNETKVAGMKTGITKSWVNPEDGHKIINILREKAFSFIEK